ncbi:MAG: response regulator, partial [Deltaproteobacteria bacterium]|nr:response regulator [Deltaproteobacteria bacterium]
RSLLADHALTVKLSEDEIWVQGDPTRLAQVVGNLLNNAAKYTPKGGRVTISLGSAEGQAVLEVADTGIGIGPEALPRIFQPFAQATRSLDRSRGGLGLGLALVKGILELHGGEVHARSPGEGKGACFTVTLPIDRHEGAEAKPEAPSPRQQGTGRRVLVIEDNRDAADSLGQVLEIAGYQVAIAYDGKAGLERARLFHPEIVLCDIGLPDGMDGYAVARAFRQDAALASTHLVALTGYAQHEDQLRAQEAGFDFHLAKPPDLDALLGLIERALSAGG